MSRKFEYISKVTNPDFNLPKRATAHSIAYDIYSPEDFTVKPGEKYMLCTNIKAQFNTDEALLINVRSSMGKKNIMLANTQGWIESDYYNNPDNEGNIGLMFYNYGTEEWKVQKNDRVAQVMFIKYLVTDDDIAEGIRQGGFGSTDNSLIIGAIKNSLNDSITNMADNPFCGGENSLCREN